MTIDKTRYFYADPRVAAYMSREFKMPISAPVRDAVHGGLKQSLRPIPDWVWGRIIENEAKGITTDERYYVLPDGLSLLKPRDGDKDEDGFVFCEKTQGWWRECGEDENGEGLNRVKLPEASTTARRDGKVFFFPQSEQPQVSA